MKKTILIISLLVFITSCTKDSNETVYYYFNTEEQNLLGFAQNDSITFIDNNGNEYNFKVTKDSLYHREFNAIITGTAFVQHNKIRIISTDTNNFFIRIDAEKDNKFYYLLEIGRSPYNEDTYFYYNFNSSIQDFESIDTVIDNVSFSGLYALRGEQIRSYGLHIKYLILMDSVNGIILIEKTDKNSNVIFRLRKK
jgi:hypothetical protein